jgi:amino acid adenylation domain-containing protein
VPLDPAYPKERLAFILQDANIGLLLTQQQLLKSLPEHSAQTVCLDADWPAIASERGEHFSANVQPENLAYVLYTSGSTGKPKGVEIEHRNVVNFLASMQREPGMRADDVLLAVTTLSFDIAGLELYLPLTLGAKVVIASREEAYDGHQLRTLLGECGATVMQATPATWRLLLESGWTGDPKLRVLCGGEALPRELAEQLRSCCSGLWNMYGPTETTIWSSLFKVDSSPTSSVPLGRPIANTTMYVLDERQQPVPVGVAGELYIGGHGVARGYYRRPELTSERFVPDPFGAEPGARLYRTGDLVKHLADGNLVFLGRTDFQVKLRGFRIELGEIESVISEHDGVQQSVAVVRQDERGNQRLIAYVVPAQGFDGDTANLALELKQSLKDRLPDYMVPSAFVALDALPLTPNGKVDRRALPVPEAVRTEKIAEPRNEIENTLLQIWREVLGVESAGVTDDFFELGGHSLLAVRLITEIEKATGKQIPLATLFRGATVEYLASVLREEVTPAHPMVAEVRGGGSQPPFFGIVTPGMNPLGYAALARHLGKDQPVYRIQGPGARLRNRPYTAAEFVNLATDYIKAMKTIQPEGPYYFGGMCEGARIAFDMARLLEAQGEQVGLLAIFDTWVIENSQIRLLWKVDYYSGRLRKFWRLPLIDKWRMARQWMRRGNSDGHDPQGLWPAAYWPGKDFVPATFGGKITVFKVPQQPYFYVRDPLMGWGSRTTGGVELHLVRLNTRKHILIFRDPYVRDLAQKLGDCLAHARERVHHVTEAERAVWVHPESPLPTEAKEATLGAER